MFDIEKNGIEVRVYTAADIVKYMGVMNDPRYETDDLFLCIWKSISGGDKSNYEILSGGEVISDGLFVQKGLKRDQLYKFMGYVTYDFAWPQPWSDSPEGQAVMRQHGWKGPGNHYPSLVWCYRGPGQERASIFGSPVFDDDVIKDMGREILEDLHNENVTMVSWPFLDKESETVDPDFDPDLDPVETS